MHRSFRDLAQACEVLRRGGLVAFPTETVYGLGANAFDPAAVERVFAAKGRPANNPLIVHVRGPEMARRVVRAWPDEADMLARRFWPGPLTMVLPRRSEVPDAVCGRALGDGSGGVADTVAVRSPDHPLALALLFEFASPLVGPSANKSGEVSPTTAEHVRRSFPVDAREDPDMGVCVLDGGPCREGIESTVVFLAGTERVVLRRGVISPEELSEALGREVRVRTPAAASGRDSLEALPGPGMLRRHYAPRAPALLFDQVELATKLPAEPLRAVVISISRCVLTPPHTVLRMPSDPHEYAAMLYAALHEADDLKPDVILIERPPGDHPVWKAVLDRLNRATAPWDGEPRRL